MNAINGNIIRQKAYVETVCEMRSTVSLYAPREDSQGNMYACSHAGEILRFNDNGEFQVFLTIGGQPSCNIRKINKFRCKF